VRSDINQRGLQGLRCLISSIWDSHKHVHPFGLRPLMGLIQRMDCSPAINRAWLRIEPRYQVAELPGSECNGRLSAALLILLTYPTSLEQPQYQSGGRRNNFNQLYCLSYANTTVEYSWGLPGQNVSHGDGLYVTNATTSAPRMSPLFGSHLMCHSEDATYPVYRFVVPQVRRNNRCERDQYAPLSYLESLS